MMRLRRTQCMLVYSLCMLLYDCSIAPRQLFFTIMKRTTIFADDAMLLDLKRVSEHEKKSLAQVMREALAAHMMNKSESQTFLSFAGKYESGRNDIAANHERLLWNTQQKNSAACTRGQ